MTREGQERDRLIHHYVTTYPQFQDKGEFSYQSNSTCNLVGTQDVVIDILTL